MCYPTRIEVVASVVAGVSAYSLFEHWSFKSLVATISLAYALGFVGNERKTQVVKASTSSKAFTHVVKKASLESVGAEIYSSSEGFSSDDEIIGNEKKAEVVRKAEVVVSSNSFSSFQDNLKLSLEKKPESRPKNDCKFAKQLSKELGAQGIQSVVYARGPDGTTGFHARGSLESEHSVEAPTSVPFKQTVTRSFLRRAFHRRQHYLRTFRKETANGNWRTTARALN